MLDHNLTITKPDYSGGSIRNLMSSIRLACGGTEDGYDELKDLSLSRLQSAKNIVLLVIDGLGADLLQQLDALTGGNGILASSSPHRLTSVYPPTTPLYNTTSKAIKVHT